MSFEDLYQKYLHKNDSEREGLWDLAYKALEIEDYNSVKIICAFMIKKYLPDKLSTYDDNTQLSLKKLSIVKNDSIVVPGLYNQNTGLISINFDEKTPHMKIFNITDLDITTMKLLVLCHEIVHWVDYTNSCSLDSPDGLSLNRKCWSESFATSVTTRIAKEYNTTENRLEYHNTTGANILDAYLKMNRGILPDGFFINVIKMIYIIMV